MKTYILLGVTVLVLAIAIGGAVVLAIVENNRVALENIC